AFPGHEIPLHVFEPRYRRMVADCVRVDRPIGVCHTKKQIRPAPQLTTTQEALQVNQATYQPYEVFSAGPCRILETLEDGRLHAAIEMSARYRVVSEVQTLPYKIVQAEALPDEDTDSEYPELQAEINERLLGLIGSEYQPLRDKLMATEWINQSSERFSFKIFQFLRFDADIMQQLLECCSIESRLQMIEGLLEGGPVH
ncbi:MAG: LON peptidase substrate-binding domain-containing protein, partial [Pseudomonadales bacterium]